MKNIIKKILQLLLPLTALLLFVILLINYFVLSFSQDNFFYQIENLPKNQVGLVFWASVKSNGTPSDILKDRLDVAISAFEKWKVKQLIVSWDNSQETYNEPVAMQEYLISMWVPKESIYLDYAGFDTFDSLYRAKHIFWVEEITLFTQDFHLKRAIYISSKLKIKTYWVQTNLHNYKTDNYNLVREVLARIKAFLDIEVNSSKPKFLWPTIDMSQPQELE